MKKLGPHAGFNTFVAIPVIYVAGNMLRIINSAATYMSKKAFGWQMCFYGLATTKSYTTIPSREANPGLTRNLTNSCRMRNP
jgi:uncharacterized membrane protein